MHIKEDRVPIHTKRSIADNEWVSSKKYKQDIQRLELQVGQLVRIIANLNERLDYLETLSTNPFLKIER